MKLSEFFETHEWTQGSYAKTVNGTNVSPLDPDATCWCVIGAIRHLYPPRSTAEIYNDDVCKNIWPRFTNVITNMSLAQWNDAPGRTKAEVISLLKDLDL